MKKRVKELRAALDFTDPESIDKNVFYKAVLTVIEAVRDFAQRYSKLAKELADKETDAKRKEELLQMSKNLCQGSNMNQQIPLEKLYSLFGLSS